MPSLQEIRTSNRHIGRNLAYKPVAVFVGGTSGIGAGMARAFARHRDGDAHIVLVGRNHTAAEDIFASFPPCEAQTAKHEFVGNDLTLMRNVRTTTAQLVERLPKVNFLVLSPGFLTLQGRTETEEGVDKKLALNYYARWRFIYDLMPLLQKAKDAGEDAKVMTVLSAGVEGSFIDLDDLGLKKGFSLVAASRTASTYSDLMIQTFAEKYPDIAFTHIAPGLVRTPIFNGLTTSHWSGRILGPLSKAGISVLGVTEDDCGEYMWHGLYAGQKGMFRRNKYGEDIGEYRMYSSEESKEKVWIHSLETTSAGLPGHPVNTSDNSSSS